MSTTIVTTVSARAGSDLTCQQPSIAREVLNSYRLGGGAQWTGDLPTVAVAPVVTAFDALVAGESGDGIVPPREG